MVRRKILLNLTSDAAEIRIIIPKETAWADFRRVEDVFKKKRWFK